MVRVELAILDEMLGPTVLIVEDDPELRGVLGRGLREEGFDVEAVATGHQALERVEHVAPDVLVIDIGLPDTDGRDLCQALRARGIQTPVLFLTAPRFARRPHRRIRRRRRRLRRQAVRAR